MVERHAFRPPTGEQAESPNAALYSDLIVSLSGPAGKPAVENSTAAKVQLAQYGGTPLEQWLLRGLQPGNRRYPAQENNADDICAARHMPSNECYDFKRLRPREQDEYDRLKSQRDRDEYMREHR